MELSCPSCSVKHRTEDHAGAFEILCVCGYSILVPDEAAFAESAPVTSHSSRVPTTLDAEDSALAVPAPEPTPELSAFEMTPPEELPEGMVYDPFEVREMGTGPMSELTPPPVDNIAASEEPAPELGFEGIVPTETSEAAPPRKAAPKAEAPRAAGQKIVERVQAASLGHLLGHSYRLRCQGLDRERLVEIANRCEALVKTRPWLETELRNRGLTLTSIADGVGLTNVPEVVALEVYLACYELGGSCSLERSP